MNLYRQVSTLVALGVGLTLCGTAQAQFSKHFHFIPHINIDVFNRNPKAVNGAQLVAPTVLPRQVRHVYNNDTYGLPRVEPNGLAGTQFTYDTFGLTSTPPGGVEHFGFDYHQTGLLQHAPLCFDWLQDGDPVSDNEVVLPQGGLLLSAERIIDKVRQSRCGTSLRALFIRRRINRVDREIDLDELVTDSPLYQHAQILDAEPFLLGFDGEISFDSPLFDIRPDLDVQGFIMAYDVFESDLGRPGAHSATLFSAATVQAVPEPGTLGLLSGIGIVGAGAVLRCLRCRK